MHPSPSYQVWEGHVLEPHHICLPGGHGAGTRTTMHAKRMFKHAHCTHTPYTVKGTAESSMQTCSTNQLEVNWLLFAIPTI